MSTATPTPPCPPPRPLGAIKSAGCASAHMDDSLRSSMTSRSSLRKALMERKMSLTGYELDFLEHLCNNGEEIEVQLAHETLMDSELFFEGLPVESKQHSHDCVGAKEVQNLSSSHRSTGNESQMDGSQRRLEVLEERKRKFSLGHMFRAHNNGLAFSAQGSRRSLFLRRSSVSSIGSRPEMYFSGATDAIFRGSGGSKGTQGNRRDCGRRVSWTAGALIATTGAAPSILRTPGRHALRRMESDSSRKSVSFSRDVPIPKQSPFGGRVASTGSIRKSKFSSERSTSMPAIPQTFDSFESSYTAPSLHRGRHLSSASLQSTRSIPSLHMANPLVSSETSLRSSGSTLSLHMAHHIHSMPSDSFPSSYTGSEMLTNVEENFTDEKKTDTWSVPGKVEIFQQSDQGQQIEPATKLLTHEDDSDRIERLVFMRRASSNKDKGEGIEVTDARLNSLILNGDNSVSTSLRSSYSFDDTMSFGRINSIFREKLTRSLSDDNLNSIFLGEARKLVRESSTLRDMSQIDPDGDGDDDDSLNIDDEISLNYFDSWKVIEDEYENGYGGGGTLPFCILGTSGDDESSLPHVLSPPLMESLQAFLPQQVSGENFWMKYSLVRDGASLFTFLQHARGATYSVLAIETIDGEVFGAFTTEPWRKNWHFFGGDESFLWRMRRTRKERSHSIIDQARMESEIEVFPFSGNNSCIQLCTQDRFAVGGGAGGPLEADTSPTSPKNHEYGFGLSVNNDMLHGTSSHCITFSSPPLCLAHADGSPFEIMNMELWTLTPCMNVEEAQKLELGQLFLGKHGRVY
ncbi:hypothetical protein FisN_34Lh057 [Fistulifera solaris]|uniref:Oxidation resistance protein 1 n=1 Tax=Fistulifera solaris TaxID=1519565 RepID=A0A1Z5JI54_FISSO|nr:hypothetical protein FisN_34Lh057 [Fistulifera solaris]|eukprot:GAX13451.1 hypothetical protein FisN_34Lh057 [Fistulifera solaris]